MASYAEFNMLKMLFRNFYFSSLVQKVHLDVQMGEHTIDPNAEKAKDTMKVMENNLQHLIDQMRYISRQQNFQRVSKHRQDGLTTKLYHINCLPESEPGRVSSAHIFQGVYLLSGDYVQFVSVYFTATRNVRRSFAK